jgi:putative NADH-flavin reductase
MNIAVIAANGRAGRAFVEAALERGHTVRGGVYANNTLPPHANLTPVTCDATNELDLTNLFEGCDAVASFIGHVKGSPANVQTEAITASTHVMQQLGMTRIVSLTGTGVRFPGDRISLMDRVLNMAVSIVDPARVQDGRNHVEVLKNSGLEWTVIRVLKLQNVPPQPFLLKEHGPTKWYVGRAEVAQAVLQVLENHSFVRQAPIIGKA